MFPKFYNRKLREFYAEDNELTADGISVEIKDNIPRFVTSGTYASLFGDQWKKFKKTQLDSYTGTTISTDRLNRCLGELKNNLTDKLVLEAGCGAGRFTEILLQKGAKLVSSDMSTAVDVNLENFPLSDHHLIIQADINDMPYMDETFDVVVCLGVIQHTPDSETTINSLYKLVKKGGALVFDHYTFTKSHLFRIAPLYRLYLKKKSAKETLHITHKLVKKYLPLHKKYSKNKLISVLLNRISPVISYYSSLPQLNNTLQEEWALLDTHDSLTDWYKRYKSNKQIISILKKLGAENIWCEYGGNGVEAKCKKPVV
jgi:2-polyprenyl-3-methyl-5-hydroxy-6-metoxy-1,4-benzoquinol methylase